MQYILFLIKEQPGRNGVTMWRLSFYCPDDHTVWQMTVDPTYRNFKRSGWDRVVRDPNPWGTYLDLKRTTKQTADHVSVASADTPARLDIRARDQAEVIRAVDQLMQERDAQRAAPPTTFGQLFEAGNGA